MKSLSKQVEDLLKKRKAQTDEQRSIRDMIELIEDLRSKGILKKPEYNLPMRDTLGRSFYESQNSHL
ncbi:MAG: hypothetical protein MUC87_09415 [Bacteroidia bacterium]|jgi:hypothetical protein|nr:hypothetical protein [Bacteroidia bacterium]